MEKQNVGALTQEELYQITNTELISNEDAIKRKSNWQLNNQNLEIKQGDFVKTTFKQEDCFTEYMWVLIDVINNEKIIGILDSKPLVLTNIKVGDKVCLNISDIQSYISADGKTVIR